MKIFGLILMTTGFIYSALLAVMNKEIVNWNYFIPAMAIAILGVILIRVSIKKQQQGESKVSLDINTIKESLNNIAHNIKSFNQNKKSINVYDIHGMIDEIFIDDIENFLKARESIIHKYDMQSYSDLMNHFAAGERYLNRTWSASADGYIDEAYTYIEKAKEQFLIAKEHFDKL